MRRAVLFQVLCGLLLTPGFGVQDPPGGPPVALAVKVEGQQNPNYVAGKLAYLHIQAVDRFGMPLPVNGDGVVVRTTDPRNRLNGLEVGFVNGKIVLKLQWFTPSKGHTIEVASKSGLKGGLTGIRVDPLPKGTKLGIVGPKPWARYLWSGGMFRLRVKATDENDDPVEHVEISLKLSKGARAFPHGYYTEDSTGIASGVIFPPEFICPGDEGGGGTVNGDAPLKLQAFIDVNGNGDIDNGEPIVEPPPADLVSSCPQVLLPAGLELLRILEEGGTLSRAPPDDVIVVGVVSAGSGGGKGKALGKNKPDTLTKSELEKIRRAKEFLKEQVIDFVNTGQWRGKFSQVRERLKHPELVLLRSIPSAEPVVQRLECAVKLMEGAPDVILQKLDVQERPGGRIEVLVGSESRFEVQNVGAVKGRRQVLADENFPDCFKPGVVEASTVGNGHATVVGEKDQPLVDFECLGRGNVLLTTTTEFKPVSVVVLPPPDNGVVAASKVTSAPQEQDFLTLAFRLVASFRIIQNDECRIRRMRFEILENEEVSFTDPLGQGHMVKVHTGIPHKEGDRSPRPGEGGRNDHPDPLVDGGIDALDPNTEKVNIGPFLQFVDGGFLAEDNLRKLEEDLSQGTPIRIFPDLRRVERNGNDKLVLRDTLPNGGVSHTRYDVVRVVAEVVNAKEGDIVWFRAFDIDDPTFTRTGATPFVDDESSEVDNRGITDPGSGRSTRFLTGLFIAAEGARLADGGPLNKGTMVKGDEIVGVPVKIEAGVANASILFMVTYSPGDNFKIAAGCGVQREGPPGIKDRNAKELLARTRNVDRPPSGDAPAGPRRDGLLLFLYPPPPARGPAEAPVVPGPGERIKRLQPYKGVTDWFWTNDPNKLDDVIKVTPALAVWRNLYIESDTMEKVPAGDRIRIRVAPGTRVDELPQVGDTPARVVFTAETMEVPFTVARDEFAGGVLRLVGEPGVADADSTPVGSHTQGEGTPQRFRVGLIKAPGAPLAEKARLEALRDAGTVLHLLDDDVRIAGGGALEAKVDTDRDLDFGLIQGKSKEDSAGVSGDRFATNRLGICYVRPNYTVLNQDAVNRNRKTPANHDLPFDERDLTKAMSERIDSRDLRSNLFWRGYFSTAFEFASERRTTPEGIVVDLAGDPPGGTSGFGQTFSYTASDGKTPGGEGSVVCLETIRDGLEFFIKKGDLPSSINLELVIRDVTLHELGHQLNDKRHPRASRVRERPGGPFFENLVTPTLKVFNAGEIVQIRSMVRGPGLDR
jgi:hypothetical protein